VSACWPGPWDRDDHSAGVLVGLGRPAHLQPVRGLGDVVQFQGDQLHRRPIRASPSTRAIRSCSPRTVAGSDASIMARRASIVTGVASAATRGALAAVPAQHQARPLGVGLFLVTGGGGADHGDGLLDGRGRLAPDKAS
jgi:hypothetical protein